MATKLVRCTCTHEFQDKTYGKGIRVANKRSSTTKGKGGCSCTVCGKEHG